MDEQLLRIKLRKIEALFAGTTVDGERDAARMAIVRIKEQLERAKNKQVQEFRFSFDSHWSCKLFIALCNRYKLESYRYSKQRRTTIMVKTTETFIRDVLSPEFKELNKVLHEYFQSSIEKIINEEFPK